MVISHDVVRKNWTLHISNPHQNYLFISLIAIEINKESDLMGVWTRVHQNIIILESRSVVCFDQRMGAPHAVRWLKSIFWCYKQLFLSLTEKIKKKEKKAAQKHIMWNSFLNLILKNYIFSQESTSFWVSTSI